MQFHTVVSLPLSRDLESAWPHLWRKAYDTKAFIPSLDELHIEEKTDQMVLRIMVMGGKVIKERIIGDPHNFTVYFHNMEGSSARGLIYNRMYRNSQGQTILEFGSNAINEAGQLMPQVELFAKTLARTKEIIENS